VGPTFGPSSTERPSNVHPYLIQIPMPWGATFRIPSYGVMLMCGFLLSLYIAQRRAKRLHIGANDVFDAAVAMLVAGVVGSRVFFVVAQWHRFRANPFDIIRIDKGGLVFYGGLIGGAAVLLFIVVRKKLRLFPVLDLVMSVVPLGHAFGRMGCFLNGCCFGKITRSWIGVRFPRILSDGNLGMPLYDVGDQYIAGSPPFLYHLDQTPPLIQKTAEWSLPVHPTQLYAVGYNLLIFAAVSLWFHRRWGRNGTGGARAGEVAWIYAILYGSFRFGNEFLRVTRAVLLGMTIAQVICVPLVILGVVMFVRGRLRPLQPLPESTASD